LVSPTLGFPIARNSLLTGMFGSLGLSLLFEIVPLSRFVLSRAQSYVIAAPSQCRSLHRLGRLGCGFRSIRGARRVCRLPRARRMLCHILKGLVLSGCVPISGCLINSPEPARQFRISGHAKRTSFRHSSGDPSIWRGCGRGSGAKKRVSRLVIWPNRNNLGHSSVARKLINEVPHQPNKMRHIARLCGIGIRRLGCGEKLLKTRLERIQLGVTHALVQLLKLGRKVRAQRLGGC